MTAAGRRRHDVDWLRVLALGLLIVYHVTLSFQPWARWIFFIQHEEALEGLWVVMSAINVWRIPILFVISGMGACFAMERRDWKQLLADRGVRILGPFAFGFFFICPISVYAALAYYGLPRSYEPNAGHLWFLANIFLYVLLLLPLLVYLKARPQHVVFRVLKGLVQRPYGLALFALPLMLEAWLVDPANFVTYAMTPHGFWLGMVCFLAGFVLVSLKGEFWRAVTRARWGALALAAGLYAVRLLVFRLEAVPPPLLAFESTGWILAILGFAARHLNRPSASLSYLSQAVYPVYIVHMPVQFCIAYFLFRLPLPAGLSLALLLAGTFGVSLLLYELVIRHLKWVQPLFGMKLDSDSAIASPSEGRA